MTSQMLTIRDSAEFLSHSFDEKLKFIKEKDGTTNPSIYKAIYMFIRKKAAMNALFVIISVAASYVGPYLIDDLVTYLNEKKTRSLGSGFLLALAFLSAKVVKTITQRRIQIARAVYQDADIYLLVQFSAVDAHTGRQLFEECLMGILKEKTIVYVTHQVEFLTAAYLILVMQNGIIFALEKKSTWLI